MSNHQLLLQKLWNYCNTLLDEGLSNGVAETKRLLNVVEELQRVVPAKLQCHLHRSRLIGSRSIAQTA